MNPLKGYHLILFIHVMLLLQDCLCRDNLTANEPLMDGEVLVSLGGMFTLGFFTPGKSRFRYVGIWYTKVPADVLWVANRDNPVNDSSGLISINSGNLELHDKYRTAPVWSTNITASTGNVFVAQLLDSGNLILIEQGGDGNTKTAVWQSYDYPTNTLLPSMKLGLDRKTGLNRTLTSWKSLDDPGTGDWSYWFDPNGSPQMVLYNNGVREWRSGPWDGLRWNGIPEMSAVFVLISVVVNNSTEATSSWERKDPSLIARFTLNDMGIVSLSTWHVNDQRWIQYWLAPEEPCDDYGYCGVYGYCDPYVAGQFKCNCLPGYEPKLPNDWYLKDGTSGCVRKRNSTMCGNGEGFVKLSNFKVPDTSIAQVDMSLNLVECGQGCLQDCSCTAYSSAEANKGVGCMTWHTGIIDARLFTAGGQDLYVRIDAIDLAEYNNHTNRSGTKKGLIAAVVISVSTTTFVLTWMVFCLIKKKSERRRQKHETSIKLSQSSRRLKDHQMEGFDKTRNPNFPFFDVNSIVAATDNFSSYNMLGQGGFGTVYKGRLVNGEEIAVKRLAKNSRQGVEEFKNEVRVILKLQHKNLVRLFGCCVHEDERMLVYEYLPNKSLDFFIFDKRRRSLLDWRKRFDIIIGIARGLLYLHQDSRLKIIHRDLKASNVLLDAAMNPKISDFGMARIFGEDQTEANTRRVVGTYGYMSPEYAMNGFYSTKSDVFSFGVLTLEIISGRKNNNQYEDNPSVNLIGYSWNMWSQDNALQLVDSSIDKQSIREQEVLRCIQIGLLCVQESSEDRPTMSSVIFMLGNKTSSLPSPNKPAFVDEKSKDSDSSSMAPSVDYATITTLAAR